MAEEQDGIIDSYGCSQPCCMHPVLSLSAMHPACRTERQALFRWLPACNFGVMLLVLLYQAPVEALLGHSFGPRQARMGTLCMCITRSMLLQPSSQDMRHGS